ncbi:NPAS1_3 [Mytilus edulis]|uniref:NPAS1_3 n=1 Tax=Mytilus edulis TaxID=6550 RepID=A0A8S3T0C2_MYTED|nr:NPAS1_3 [Mytilus edulis]
MRDQHHQHLGPMSPSNPDRVAYMIPNPDRPLERTFCLRMKSTLTKRGVHVRTSGYRVVYVTAHFRPQMCFNLNRKSTTQYLGLVGIAIALPPPTITELRIESDTFSMRLSPNLKIIYCDTIWITELTDWNSDDANNRMFYDFCHAGDVIRILKHHEDCKFPSSVEYFIEAVMDQNQTSGPRRTYSHRSVEHQSFNGSDIGMQQLRFIKTIFKYSYWEETILDLGWQNLDDINPNSVASSVKDLEDVMNRHLPVTGIDNGMKSPTDLTVQSIGGAINRQRSAIQWAGNSHDSSTLPASKLITNFICQPGICYP